MDRDILINNIVNYMDDNNISLEQKYALRDIIINTSLNGIAAEDTKTGFNIILDLISDIDILIHIYNILTTSV